MDEGKMGMYKENPLSLKKYYQFYLKYYYCFLPLRKWSLIKNSQGLFQLYYILLKYFKQFLGKDVQSFSTVAEAP